MPRDLDPTGRFSDRVEDYVRYRPSYPARLLDLLRREVGLEPGHVVADVGSGTGLLSRLFVEAGHRVLGVEPNLEMAAAAEALFADEPLFESRSGGTAEETGLADAAVDLVVVGQAFHWFDAERTAVEFRRILRPGGQVVVVWNQRRFDTPFLAAYESFLQEWGTDYGAVSAHYEHPRSLAALFGGDDYERRELANEQVFDFAGLRGRLLSSSYAPAHGHPRHEGMLVALRRLFDAHEENGVVRFLYRTAVYFGTPAGAPSPS